MDSTPSPMTPAQLVARLDESIIGQTDAKRAMAAAAWFNQHRRNLILKGHDPRRLPAKQNVLIMGPSGSGKSAMARALAELLGVPVFFTTATSYSIPGLVGLDVDDMIAGLLSAAEGNVERAQMGIVVIDEVDKLKRRDWGGQADVGGESIQQGMLSILEGCDAFPKYRNERTKVKTDHITFIATGAFTDLVGNPGPVPAQEVIDAGFIPEFVARFPLRVRLEALDDVALYRILTESSASPVRQLIYLFNLHQIELKFEPSALGAIITSALTDGVGARALNQVVWERCNSLIAELPDLVAAGVTRVVVDRQVIEKGLSPWKIAGDPPAQAGEQVPGFASLPSDPDAKMVVLHPFTPSIPDTRGWSNERKQARINELLAKLDYEHTTGSARKWIDAFMHENTGTRQSIVLELYELLARIPDEAATVTEFFLAYVYSNTDSLLGNVFYLLYQRLKKQEERRKRDQAATDAGARALEQEESNAAEGGEAEPQPAPTVEWETGQIVPQSGQYQAVRSIVGEEPLDLPLTHRRRLRTLKAGAVFPAVGALRRRVVWRAVEPKLAEAPEV